MTTDKDGGAAFPHDGMPRNPSMIQRTESSGMSLRDWFAGQALAGFLAGNDPLPGIAGSDIPKKVAQMSYLFADALLTARQGETK